MRIFQVQRLELPLNPLIEFLECSVKVSRRLFHQLHPQHLILTFQQRFAVFVDLFDTSKNFKEAVINRLHRARKSRQVLVGDDKVFIESIEYFLLSLGLLFGSHQQTSFLQHRSSFLLRLSNVLSHLITRIVERSNHRANPFELLSAFCEQRAELEVRCHTSATVPKSATISALQSIISFCASCLKFLLVSALFFTPLASRIARASRMSASAKEDETRVVILPEIALALADDEALPKGVEA